MAVGAFGIVARRTGGLARLSLLGLSLSTAARGAEPGGAVGAPEVRATVPTKGCPSVGMVGDRKAPAMPRTLRMSLPPAAVGRVAVYRAAWPYGIVGPLGWDCVARSGSSGIALIVAPPGTDLDAAAPSGPMIALHLLDGGTSGRFAAAAVASRAFPILTGFARRVKAEGIDAEGIVFAPFPRDEITRLSDRAILFRTPASAAGLGTSVDLGPGPGEIRGSVTASGGDDAPMISMLSVRLPPGDAALYPAVVAGVVPARFIADGEVPEHRAPPMPRRLDRSD